LRPASNFILKLLQVRHEREIPYSAYDAPACGGDYGRQRPVGRPPRPLAQRGAPGRHRGRRRIVEACREAGIEFLTLYTFSRENWRRPAAEVAFLFDLLVQFITRELPELENMGVRLQVLGEFGELPFAARKALGLAASRTARCDKMILNLALNYSGREELARAARLYMEAGGAPATMTPEALAAHLYTAGQPDPDLIIRTSGELRLSNFLLFQSAYSELYFTPTLWPDFTPEELRKALAEYAGRARRFGGSTTLRRKHDPRRASQRLITGGVLALCWVCACGSAAGLCSFSPWPWPWSRCSSSIPCFAGDKAPGGQGARLGHGGRRGAFARVRFFVARAVPAGALFWGCLLFLFFYGLGEKEAKLGDFAPLIFGGVYIPLVLRIAWGFRLLSSFSACLRPSPRTRALLCGLPFRQT
jgi:undecaprenyl diphosphate synthase